MVSTDSNVNELYSANRGYTFKSYNSNAFKNKKLMIKNIKKIINIDDWKFTMIGKKREVSKKVLH